MHITIKLTNGSTRTLPKDKIKLERRDYDEHKDYHHPNVEYHLYDEIAKQWCGISKEEWIRAEQELTKDSTPRTVFP